jgi:hypothetical protein
MRFLPDYAKAECAKVLGYLMRCWQTAVTWWPIASPAPTS